MPYSILSLGRRIPMRCAHCGKRFEPNKHAYGQKYCTHACKAAAERQKKLKGKSLKPVISAGCNFQTIPQAPNYEMNPQGIVRNKKTGYVLKWSTGGRTRSLRFDSCRQAALFLASVTSKTFSTCARITASRICVASKSAAISNLTVGRWSSSVTMTTSPPIKRSTWRRFSATRRRQTRAFISTLPVLRQSAGVRS